MRILNQGCAIIESDGGLSLFSFASRPTSQLTVWQHTIGLKYDRNIEIYICTYVDKNTNTKKTNLPSRPTSQLNEWQHKIVGLKYNRNTDT